MVENKDSSKLRQDSKQLAIVIYDFLLQESSSRRLDGPAKVQIAQAADALHRAYKISMWDYVFAQRGRFLRRQIVEAGFHPVPIRNRIEAQRHKRLGNDLMNAELYRMAEVEYTKAIRLDPRNAIYYCNRAASRIRQGLFTDAVTDCNLALELDRQYAKAYSWLGIAHAMMDHPALAIRSYRRALRIEPGNRVYVENMELINRKINHAAFRVLAEPFNACRRGLARLASSLMACNKHRNWLFRPQNGQVKTEILQIEGFGLGDQD